MMQIDMILSQVTGSDAQGLVIPTAWNPLDKSSAVELSNNNRTMTRPSGSGYCLVRTVASVTTGKWYVEFSCAYGGVGVVGASHPVNTFVGGASGSIGYLWDGWIWKDNVRQEAAVSQWNGSGVVGCALDADARSITFYLNGSLVGTYSVGGSGPLYLAANSYDSSQIVIANFGASAFVYPVPTGYTAGFGVLRGEFATTLYTGNGGAQNILNGVDLQGSGGLVVTKARSNAGKASVWIDSARGGSSTLFSNSQGPAVTDAAAITGFTGDGYSVGGAPSLNAAGDSLVSWAFRQSPRFFKPVVVNHTNGTASVVDLSSLGTVGMTITKTATLTNHWWVNHRSFPATGFARLDTIDQVNTGDTWTLGADSLTISADSETQTYIVYAFGHDVAGDGRIQCGIYTEGLSDVNVALGWPAQFVLTKPINALGNWWVEDTARGFGKGLRLNTTDSDVSAAYYAEHSNGFTAKAENFGANTQIVYMAIRAL
jgi:hypothetical protein